MSRCPTVRHQKHLRTFLVCLAASIASRIRRASSSSFAVGPYRDQDHNRPIKIRTVAFSLCLIYRTMIPQVTFKLHMCNTRSAACIPRPIHTPIVRYSICHSDTPRPLAWSESQHRVSDMQVACSASLEWHNDAPHHTQ